MDYQKIVEYRNSHNPFAQKNGIRLQEIRTGYARGTKTIGADDCNPGGLAHGGCFLCLADTVCGCATLAHGHPGVTIDFQYHFLRGGALGDVITAEAQELRHGSHISLYEVRLRNQREELVGTASLSFYELEETIEF